MGTARSRLVRTVKKPIETWGKAEEILERKPEVAPRHPSTKATLDKVENGTSSLPRIESLGVVYNLYLE